MRKKILQHLCLLAIVSVVVTTGLLSMIMHRTSVSHMEQQVRNEGAYLALALEQDVPVSFLKEASFVLPLNRITLIESDGTVLFDDRADTASMENHLDRIEVQEALRFGNGSSRRFSATTGNNTFYYAQKLSSGRILRTSITVNLAQAAFFDILPWFVVMVLVEIAFCILLASYQTKTIVSQIEEINLDDPLSGKTFDELAPMLIRMNNQKKQIAEQMDQMQRQQNEFMDVTENMQEGLIVLGLNGQVISINRSAALLFGIQADQAREKNLLSIHRSPLLQQVTSQAYNGKSGECNLSIGGRHYQVLANPVWDNEMVKGAVLLLFDMTEKLQAEAMRREFTANVSHELKTPLTTIQGYGELMLNGLSKEEDKQDFIRRIYDESSRMIDLVENIMKLSRLDEWNMHNATLSEEGVPDSSRDMDQSIDLLALAQRIVDRMGEKAAEKSVEILLSGSPCFIHGNEMLLDEMVSNLCDNGIKYNHPGGKVTITTAITEDQAVLCVQDTGIGIEEEYRDRVFERFFRVDQSRSRKPEGSGLGLAIVKHIVQLHHGTVEIDSKIDQGTTITVYFPLLPAL